MNAPAMKAPVLVVGAGIMGAGIAQIAAQAGHRVYLQDQRPGAAQSAKAQLQKTLEGLASKGKLSAQEVSDTLQRIEPVDTLEAAASAQVVVEAIVENLEAKQALFLALEGLVGGDAVLCSNTSSISITAIGKALARPERLVGMHFFNPVPVMKLVEVVHGLRTDASVAQRIAELAVSWGKTAVHTRSTPGFIVNRIARPYYAEALALLQEQAAAPEVLDACLRAAGFRMGPFELMDLIGHDTNFAVTCSVYNANFQDKRYVPSLVQAELVAGGLLGRKSGRGFYTYPAGAPALAARTPLAWPQLEQITVHGTGPWAEALAERMQALSTSATPFKLLRDSDSAWTGLTLGELGRLVLSDGRPAHAWRAAWGQMPVAVLDWPLAWPARDATTAPAWAYALAASDDAAWQSTVEAFLCALGATPWRVADAPGLVVARTVAMLINEAADAVQQGVCTPEGADTAMKLGVNYPAGPFEWLQRVGRERVLAVLNALDDEYRGERYRPSPWLRRTSKTTP